MRFHSDFPETLRSSLRASEVIGRRVALKKRGKEYMGLCPFHQEKSPSFTVNDEKEFYHCFGCGAHGDIIKFTMETEGLNYAEAVVKLANDFHLNIPFIEDKPQTEAEQIAERCQERYYTLMETATKYFQTLLNAENARPDAVRAQLYLRQRHFSAQTIQEFRLGYAPDSYTEVSQYLHATCQATDAELTTLGLVSRGDNGRIYDKFRGRLMFPIFNKHHFAIAFGGRVLDDSKPKYLNSPETPIFHKGSMVYNYSLARKGMYDQNQVILVEGYIDATSMYSHGITNVVATLGTAITVQQLQLLWKSVDTIIICLDGDLAGQHAMQRVADLALPYITPQKNLGFVTLPDGKDPDDYIAAEGATAMLQQLSHFKPLSEALWLNTIAMVSNSPNANYLFLSAEQKSLVEYKLSVAVNKIANTHVRKYFQQYFWEQSGLHKRYHPEVPVATINIKPSFSHLSNQERREVKIIEILLAQKANLEGSNILKTILDLQFVNEKLEELKETLINETIDPEELPNLLQQYPEFQFEPNPIPTAQAENLLLYHLKNHQFDALEADLKQQLNQGGFALEKVRALKQYELELRKEIFTLKELLGVYGVN